MQRWQVSTRGGSQPRWTRNGQELVYLEPDGTLMSVAIRTQPSFEARAPQPLFKVRVSTTVSPWRSAYVPTADGERFLVSSLIRDPDPGAINVVVNWPALLNERSP
jgi:hypothetical protein